MNLRISLVHYLNAAPLGWYFLHGPDRNQFQILRSSPAHCADQLRNGEVDVGLIPSIEYQCIPGLRVIPDIAIAAVNEVRSVLLIRPRSVSKIRSVALDTSSRTSTVLLRLLLQHRMGLQPEFVPHAPVVAEMLRICDAALLIGDAALRCSTAEFEVMDLGAEWRAWQGKPFVFAFWACRADAPSSNGLVEVFQTARDWGVARIPEIAEAYSELLELPAAFLEGYLRRNLDHHLRSEHQEGLDRFYRLAQESGYIRERRPVRFLAG